MGRDNRERVNFSLEFRADRSRKGACRKFLALTARQAWWSTLSPPLSGGGAAHDPECDCHEAEAVWRRARRNTVLSVNAVAIARDEQCG